jgi:hypothetical protein
MAGLITGTPTERKQVVPLLEQLYETCDARFRVG